MRPDRDATAAVLIGSRHYQPEIGDELPGAAWSVRSFGHLLTTPRFGLPRSAIEVIGDDETRDPSTLRTHLKSFARAARDTTLIYFVGHGQTTGDRKELYLQLPATRGEDIHESSLRFFEIWETLMVSETRLKVAILDCCFAGVALDRPLLESVRRRAAEGAGCFLVASVSGESTAFAPPESVHTAYSGHLIDVLDSGLPSTNQRWG